MGQYLDTATEPAARNERTAQPMPKTGRHVQKKFMERQRRKGEGTEGMEEELGPAEMVEAKGPLEVLAGGEARKDRSRRGLRILTCRLQVITEGHGTSTSVRHEDPQAVPHDKGARAWLLAGCERTIGAASRKL